ncbi:MAG: prepilin peptidase [bacterium]|nr:prepilin peptidase [bacterium]
MGLLYLFVFVLGLTIGSFLNCLIYRLETGQGFVSGRSFCPSCRHLLGWKDLIPVLSFILLKGRCRYCKKKISWQYPLVEILTGLIFLLIFNFSAFAQDFGGQAIFQFSNLVYLLVISSLLIVVFVFDLKHYLIPDEIIYSAIVVSGIWYLVSSIIFGLYTKYEILNTIYSSFGVALFFWLIHYLSQGRAMGFGDVKLAFLMGLLLGFPKILVALFFAFSTGAAIGLGLMVFKKKTLKSELPFGPFLAAGTLFALFLGTRVFNLYIHFLAF